MYGPHVVRIADEFCRRSIGAENGKWNRSMEKDKNIPLFGRVLAWCFAQGACGKTAAATYAVKLPFVRLNPA
jgi:hypothetical protein